MLLTSCCLSTDGNADNKNVNPNKANAMYSILFEAIALALHLDMDRNMLTACVATLGKFLNHKVGPKCLGWSRLIVTMSSMCVLPDSHAVLISVPRRDTVVYKSRLSEPKSPACSPYVLQMCMYVCVRACTEVV